MLEIANGASLAYLVSIGHETRLFDTMAKLDQFTTSNHRELALKGFKHDVPVCAVDWAA